MPIDAAFAAWLRKRRQKVIAVNGDFDWNPTKRSQKLIYEYYKEHPERL